MDDIFLKIEMSIKLVFGYDYLKYGPIKSADPYINFTCCRIIIKQTPSNLKVIAGLTFLFRLKGDLFCIYFSEMLQYNSLISQS